MNFQAMAQFHRKAEKAYRESGQEKQAEMARKLAEQLEALLVDTAPTFSTPCGHEDYPCCGCQ